MGHWGKQGRGRVGAKQGGVNEGGGWIGRGVGKERWGGG